MTKKKETKAKAKAKAKDYPNLMPLDDDGLTVTKADFETRRIQAMEAIAAADRRYQNFWRAVRFGNQYMLAFLLAGLVANYQKESLMMVVGDYGLFIAPLVSLIVAVIGISNMVTWKQLYKVMGIAIKQEEKVTQLNSKANVRKMTWSTMQHFMIQATLTLAAAALWYAAFI